MAAASKYRRKEIAEIPWAHNEDLEKLTLTEHIEVKTGRGDELLSTDGGNRWREP